MHPNNAILGKFIVFIGDVHKRGQVYNTSEPGSSLSCPHVAHLALH